MKRWLMTSFIAGLMGFSAYAVESFSLPAPLDDASLRGACLNAFSQAKADKEAYESQPQINLKCASQLSGSQVAEMQDYFVGLCMKAARTKAPSDVNQIEMNETILAGQFDTAYGGVFRGHCLDTAMNAYNQSNAAQSYASSSVGPASAASDGCYAFSGCR